MPVTPDEMRPAPLLLPPSYGHADDLGAPRRPTVREAIADWVDAINPVRDPSRAVPLVAAAAHVLMGLTCLWFFTAYLT